MRLEPRLDEMPLDGQKMLRHQTLLLPIGNAGRLPDEEEDHLAVVFENPGSQRANAPYFRMQRTALNPSVQRTFLPSA